jgi:YD repeat-containing protein
MPRQYLKDKTNRTIGSIDETAIEKVAYDAHNRRNGRYDKRSNKTYDGSNRLVGSGDQLSALIVKVSG